MLFSNKNHNLLYKTITVILRNTLRGLVWKERDTPRGEAVKALHHTLTYGMLPLILLC